MNFKKQEAMVWADLLWSQASADWVKRKQDYNYRHYLVQPEISSTLKSLHLPKKFKVVDFGCAEGNETFFIAHILEDFGYQAEVYGFDTNLTQLVKNKNIIFDQGTLKNLLGKHQLFGKVDLLTSIFVFQELINIDEILANIQQALSPCGKAVILLVHPNFGKILLKKSVLVLNQRLSFLPEVDWEFAAAYPIVEEDGQTFFLPYFHRSVETYRVRLEKKFKILSVIGLKPDLKTLGFCQRHKISPFYDHPGNVYWPEIGQQASSLLIIVSKKGK